MSKIKSSKKGQGISLNVIIVAAIGLIVLVVLTFIFLGRIGGFGIGTTKCVDQGGECYTNGCPTDYQKIGSLRCYNDNNEVQRAQVCCKRLLG